MTETTQTPKPPPPVVVPLHQWTYKGNRVLVMKCTEPGGKSRDGFQYPASGKVRPAYCSLTPDCDSGGLFGWAWGLNLGVDKEPDYQGDWFVLSAPPEQVVAVGEKVKIAAATPAEVDADIVYHGDILGAMMFVHTGKMAWIKQAAGAATSGGSSSAATSGDRSSAKASGKASIAAVCGEECVIEVGPEALGAIVAKVWTWKQHVGAVVVCRWQDPEKQWQHQVFVGTEEKTIIIKNGVIQP